MRTQLVLIVHLFAAMLRTIAIVGLNSVDAQNTNSPETSMINASMGGNMTGSSNLTTSDS